MRFFNQRNDLIYIFARLRNSNECFHLLSTLKSIDEIETTKYMKNLMPRLKIATFPLTFRSGSIYRSWHVSFNRHFSSRFLSNRINRRSVISTTLLRIYIFWQQFLEYQLLVSRAIWNFYILRAINYIFERLSEFKMEIWWHQSVNRYFNLANIKKKLLFSIFVSFLRIIQILQV